jgi:hypothetical protein
MSCGLISISDEGNLMANNDDVKDRLSRLPQLEKAELIKL